MKELRWISVIVASHRRRGRPLAGLLMLACAACLDQPYRACDTGLVCQLGYECSPKGDFCALLNGCGNGRIDPDEVCDDGNRVSGDGCSQSCKSNEICGNGVRDQWERCDDGNRVSDDGCSETCRLERCGNGELDHGEACDDGNSENGDGCSADCLSTEACGNGYLDIAEDEECDDGNAVSGDGCSADCMDEHCGNGAVDPGEGCDDGGNENDDGCSADCKSDEACGNHIVDFSIGEQCDDGNDEDGDGCSVHCWRSTCGDGKTDAGEECDDGNSLSGDGCSADCLYEAACGNGALDPGEMCDPGASTGCNADCTSDQTCNNGYLDPGTDEECDDRDSSPYCDFDCTRVVCGDGVRNDAAGETCDDGTVPLLANLVVSEISPAIELVPDKFDYEVDLPLLQQSVTVTGTVATAGDKLTIAGTSVDSGEPSPPIPLSLGDNVVDIVVEDPLGWKRTYHLTLRRAAQLAQYAYGKASNTDTADDFGRSVALSGDTLAVGTPYEDSAATGVNGNESDDSASNSGAVYVFRRRGMDWQQEAYLKASNTGTGDEFGWSVALAGDTLAVGAYHEDSATTGVNGNQASNAAADSGAVYVFRHTGTAWQQEAYLKASNTDSGDAFGYGVALEGDTLVVGASGEDSAATGANGNQEDNSVSNSGAVYMFRRTGTAWQQEAYLKASNTGSGDNFGARVALAGDTLAIGASREDSATTGVNGNETDDSASNSGAVYVFRSTGTVWQQEAYVKASNTGEGDYFGTSVAVSGDTLAVGAYLEASGATGINGNQDNASAPFSGAVYVFRRTGADWHQEAYVKASNTGTQDYFGGSIALAGDMLAVTANREDSRATGVNGNQADDSAPGSGAVYVFRRTGPVWQQEAYVKASNTGGSDDSGDNFGASIALSGDTLAIGANWEDSAAMGVNGNQVDNTASDSGALYIFH